MQMVPTGPLAPHAEPQLLFWAAVTWSEFSSILYKAGKAASELVFALAEVADFCGSKKWGVTRPCAEGWGGRGGMGAGPF